MEDDYTEYIREKTTEEKLSVTLESDREDLYSGWEINNITLTINNTYYKGELLNTLRSLIKQGSNPKNIYVLSNSFNIKQLYRNLEDGKIDLTSEKGVAELYHLGNPSPLYPEKNIMLLSLAFELYSKLYSYCGKRNINPPNKNEFLSMMYFKLFIKEENVNLRETIKNELERHNLIRQKEVPKDKEESIKIIKNEIKNVLSYLGNDFSTYEKLEDTIISEAMINESLLKKLSPYREYFRFSDVFNRLERPVVCVYDKEKHIIDVLCYDLIVRNGHNENNYRFLKTRNISQNSPLIIDIMLGAGYLGYLFNYIERKILLKRAQKQKLQNNIHANSQERIAELDKEISELIRMKNNQALVNENKKIEKLKFKKDLSKVLNYTAQGIGEVTGELDKINSKIDEAINETLEDEEINLDNIKFGE